MRVFLRYDNGLMALFGMPNDPQTRRLLSAGFLAFILIGALQAMYGPAFPALRERYGLTAEQVGTIVSMHFFGSFITIALSGVFIRNFGYRRVITAATLVMALGSFGIAYSPNWTLTLAFAFLLGLGFGGVDVAVNLLFARAFEANSAPALNFLNAMFGVGAVLGPLFIGLFLPVIKTPFTLAAITGIILFILALGIQNPPVTEDHTQRIAIPYFRLFGFVLMYFVYVMAEVGVGSWESTHLEPRFGAEQAASFTALYWGAITIGRFLATPISHYIKANTLVLSASALALIGILLAHYLPTAPYAYALIGLAFAPIFPTGLAWLQDVFPQRAEQLAPIVIAIANLGPVIGSPLIGRIIEQNSSAVIPTTLAGIMSVLLLVTVVLWVSTRTRTRV